MRIVYTLSVILLLFISGCSIEDNEITLTTPAAPNNLTATVISTTQVNLRWTDNSDNESGFKVQRKTIVGNYTDVASSGADVNTYSDFNLSPNTTYIYRVYAYNSTGNSLLFSNEDTVTTTISTVTVADIITATVTAITDTGSICGGDVTANGGATVTARGICWSTSSNPTISLSTKTTDGSGTGVFTSTMSGLMANTVYYVRAYATNSVGTAYGAEQTFTTTNTGVVIIPSVTIGTQIWSSVNLDVATYRNGDPIPQVTDPSQWINLTSGAWCWYNNDSATYAAVYGKLYNWYAVNDPRGLAPQGWHVATDSEWTTLTTFLGGESVAGGKLKTTGTQYWESPNTGATNSTGFSALPGGVRGGDFSSGSFAFTIRKNGYWWTSSSSDPANENIWIRTMRWDQNSVYRTVSYKRSGQSVRLVKD